MLKIVVFRVKLSQKPQNQLYVTLQFCMFNLAKRVVNWDFLLLVRGGNSLSKLLDGISLGFKTDERIQDCAENFN